MWRSEFAGIPAFSNASDATSSSSRCWGSILTASRGEISKNSASKAPMSLRKEPQRVVPAIAASVSGEPSSNGAHRSAGTSCTAERPSQRNRHNSSGPEMSPGKRQPIPITAIGSSREPRSALVSGSAAGLLSAPVRNFARAEMLGYAQNSTGETVRPSSSESSPESTTASREPTPRSFIDASTSMSSGLHPMLVRR